MIKMFMLLVVITNYDPSIDFILRDSMAAATLGPFKTVEECQTALVLQSLEFENVLRHPGDFKNVRGTCNGVWIKQ